MHATSIVGRFHFNKANVYNMHAAVDKFHVETRMMHDKCTAAHPQAMLGQESPHPLCDNGCASPCSTLPFHNGYTQPVRILNLQETMPDAIVKT